MRRAARQARREAALMALRSSSAPVADLAKQFGVSVSYLYMIARAARVALPRRYAAAERHLAIIADYQGGKSAQRVGEDFGVSRQRVQQILKKHDIKARPRRLPQPRIEWRCDFCAKARLLTRFQYQKSATRCRSCSKLDGERVERFIASRRQLGNWHRVGLAAGYKPNAIHQVPRFVYCYLLRSRDVARISACWPRGVPQWLRDKCGAPPKEREAA